MTECSENTCVQRTKIALLDENKKSMAKKINDIDNKVDNISANLAELKNIILTQPMYFVSKIEFEKLEKDTTDFKNTINLKIATVVGGSTVALYFINKLI